MSSRRKWLCLDCGVDCGSEHFMLKDEIWYKVHDSRQGMLCIACLEKRLGRKLVPNDFNSSYINDIHYGSKSLRLISRLK